MLSIRDHGEEEEPKKELEIVREGDREPGPCGIIIHLRFVY